MVISIEKNSHRRSDIRLYLIFAVTFLVMHLTGTAVFHLPYILNAAITAGVVLATLVLLVKWAFGGSFDEIMADLGLRGTRPTGLVPGVVMSGLLLLVYPLLGYMLGAKISLAEHWLPNLAGLCLTAGIAEEALFRGFVFGRLRRTRSFRRAVILSMLCFVLTHLLLFAYFVWPVALMSNLLAVGLALPLAYLYEKADNTIWSAALVHTIVRTIGLVFTTSEEHFMPLALWWMVACLVVPYLVLLIYKDFRKAAAGAIGCRDTKFVGQCRTRRHGGPLGDGLCPRRDTEAENPA